MLSLQPAAISCAGYLKQPVRPVLLGARSMQCLACRLLLLSSFVLAFENVLSLVADSAQQNASGNHDAPQVTVQAGDVAAATLYTAAFHSSNSTSTLSHWK